MTDAELIQMISKSLSCRIEESENCMEKMEQLLGRCFYRSGQYDSLENFKELDEKSLDGKVGEDYYKEMEEKGSNVMIQYRLPDGEMILIKEGVLLKSAEVLFKPPLADGVDVSSIPSLILRSISKLPDENIQRKR
ncbi:Glucose-6-phosphate 1-dehydrogenase, chloroplastic-like protein [Drosera capensis]